MRTLCYEQTVTGAFDISAVSVDARTKERLDDFGDAPFEEPLGVLLDSYAAAPLNDVGVHLMRGGVVNSLRMRLRANEWFRCQPEIADERIVAPIVVVGMMRSGTTLVQRLLAADPRFHCAYGWEVRQVAPPPDVDWAEVDPRIAAAEARDEQTRAFVPELYAIHPMYACEAEEEIMFLSDAFLSHVPESSARVPTYRSWIDTQDFSPAYDNLHRMLQLIQWQKRRRGLVADRWVLKTPAHLGYLRELRNRFPDLHLVHMHRDPLETIPSGASLNATLWAMHADAVDRREVGAEWIDRMGWTNDRSIEVRAAWGDDPSLVTDIAFEEAVADPFGQIERVYAAIGVDLTGDADAAMRSWYENRQRETIARPSYTAEEFGLSAGQIEGRFAEYNERFRRT